MQDEIPVIPDQMGRRIRGEKIFELMKAALSGMMVGKSEASEEELKRIAQKAVKSAQLSMRELIKERVL